MVVRGCVGFMVGWMWGFMNDIIRVSVYCRVDGIEGGLGLVHMIRSLHLEFEGRGLVNGN